MDVVNQSIKIVKDMMNYMIKVILKWLLVVFTMMTLIGYIATFGIFLMYYIWELISINIGWRAFYGFLMQYMPTQSIAKAVTKTYNTIIPEELTWQRWIEIKLTYVISFLTVEEWIIVGVSAVGLVFLVYLVKLNRKLIDKLRGIEYYGEAMMPGSILSPATIPSCQIALYKNGIISKTFVGYAIRVKTNLIAMPKHVYNVLGGEILFQAIDFHGKPKWILVKTSKVDSIMVRDLCYVTISSNLLTELKATVARLAKRTLSNVAASVVGMDGMSSGVVMKHPTLGLLMYRGSTKPGYSGAAYMQGTTVLGMHCGIAGNVNLGVASIIMEKETAQLFPKIKGEAASTFTSPTSDDPESVFDRIEQTAQEWEDQNVEKHMRREINFMQEEKNWNMQTDDDLNYDFLIDWDVADPSQGLLFNNSQGETTLKFENYVKVLDKMSMDRLEAVQAAIDLQKKKRVVITGHSPETPEVELAVVNEDEEIMDQFLQMFVHMRERIKNVETEIIKIKQHIEREPSDNVIEYKEKSINCSHEGCEKKFKSLLSMKMHCVQSHDIEIQGENYIEDSKDTTKPSSSKAFLGKSSPPVKNYNWRNNSNFSGKPQQYRYTTQNQRNMPYLERMISSILEKKLKDLHGQSLATTQS